jgi:hypothetical protein
MSAEQNLSGPVPARPRRRPGALAVTWLAVFAAFAILYGLTCQDGPSWQDSGLFQLRILAVDWQGRLGLALSHPVLIAVGQVARHLPGGSLAWRLHMISAVFSAAAMANLAVFCRRLLGGRRLPAYLAAAALGLAHTSWWLSTILECQSLYLFVLTVELNVLLGLLRRPNVPAACLLAFLAGLGWGVHNFELLAWPAWAAVTAALLWRRKLPLWTPAAMLAAWAAGGAGMIALIAREAASTGLVAAVHSALFGGTYRGSVLAMRLRPLAMGFGYVLYNFPNLVLPLSAAGVVAGYRLLRRDLWAVMVYLTAIFGVFALRYDVPDQFTFFLPFYLTLAVWAAGGAAVLAGRHVRWVVLAAASIALNPLVYLLVPIAWQAAGLPVPGRKDLALRDPVTYWLQPWKHDEDSAERFARAALEEVPAGSLIVADGTSLRPLRWMKTQGGLGGDVRLWAGEPIRPGTEDVYTTSDRPKYLPEDLLGEGVRFARPEGAMLFRIVWPQAGGESRSPTASASATP